MKNAQIMYFPLNAASSKFINQLVMKEYLTSECSLARK